MKIFIDNGYDRNTAGKRSPDRQFLEYYYNCIVARRVTAKLLPLREDRTAIRACATLGNIRGGTMSAANGGVSRSETANLWQSCSAGAVW